MKSIISLLFLLGASIVFAQDAYEKKYFVKETAAFVESSFIISKAVGDNYLTEATELKNGVAFKAGYFFYDKFYAGASYHTASLGVTDKEIYGFAQRATFASTGFLAGYSYDLTERTSIKADAGFGWIRFKNRLSGEIETSLVAIDRGTFVNGNVSIDYKLTKHLAIFTGFGYQYNFMEIRTAPELQPLFENSAFIMVQAGIRFYLR